MTSQPRESDILIRMPQPLYEAWIKCSGLGVSLGPVQYEPYRLVGDPDDPRADVTIRCRATDLRVPVSWKQ